MTDPMQQARELLPCPFCGGEATLRMVGNVRSTRRCIVKCSGCRYQRIDAALRYGDEWLLNTAIAAWNRRTALRAAPDGFVLVPVEPSEEWVRSVIRTWQPVLREGCKGWRELEDELMHWHAAMLDARPQGVKDRPPIDGCTESNCKRCRTHPNHRGDMEHAGIGWRPDSPQEASDG